MKEIYTKPVAEIEEFAKFDVLTASSNPDPIEDNNIWD